MADQVGLVALLALAELVAPAPQAVQEFLIRTMV